MSDIIYEIIGEIITNIVSGVEDVFDLSHLSEGFPSITENASSQSLNATNETNFIPKFTAADIYSDLENDNAVSFPSSYPKKFYQSVETQTSQSLLATSFDADAQTSQSLWRNGSQGRAQLPISNLPLESIVTYTCQSDDTKLWEEKIDQVVPNLVQPILSTKPAKIRRVGLSKRQRFAQ